MFAKKSLVIIFSGFCAAFFLIQGINKAQQGLVPRDTGVTNKGRQGLVPRDVGHVASRKPSSIPQYCFNASVWNGSWDLKPYTPPEALVAQRYHSKFESPCNMTDILRLAKSEVVTGHMNDQMEREVIARVKGLRGETLLQFGTSVDMRLLRIGCPLFGVQRKVHNEGRVHLSVCVIPLINVTIAYAFNGPLTKDNWPIEYQTRYLEETAALVANSGIEEPKFILLSGIEWDLKWFKDNEQPIRWKPLFQITKAKVSLFLRHFPRAKALFLRTQPFLIGKNGSLAPEATFRRYNNLFREAARRFNLGQNICGRVHLADLDELMLFNGTNGWSDGIHPSKWTSMQFMNILFNVMALIGAEC